jgi:hypothetical protein
MGAALPASAALFAGGPATIFEVDVAGAMLHRAGGAGDVNGDGYDDVFVVSPAFAPFPSIWIFHGSAAGIANGHVAAAQHRLDGTAPGTGLGVAAHAGDVNGDGYDDLLVCDPYEPSDGGAVFVFHGGPSGITATGVAGADATLTGGQADARFGTCNRAGDVNDDGYDDIVVGAPDYDHGETNEGAVFLFLGSPSGIASGDATSAAAMIEADVHPFDVASSFGATLGAAGDVNGDGYDDVIIGNPQHDAGHPLSFQEGGAWILHGGPLGLPSGNPSIAATEFLGTVTNGRFGLALGGAGDVDGDGYEDVFVTGHYTSNDGELLVYRGGPSGVASASQAQAFSTLRGVGDNGFFAHAAAGVGDVDGNGFADLVVSDFGHAPPVFFRGGLHLFAGRRGGLFDAASAEATESTFGDEADRLGWVVAEAGDVNGDGAPDVIAGAIGWDAGETDEGAALLYLGTPGVCGDGVDQDGDLAIDFPADPGCASATDDTETVDCANGLDDDGDQFVDAADPGCSGPDDGFERGPGLPCDDDVDDDLDKLVDSPADLGCFDAYWPQENSACDDDLDNDGDGGIDWDGGASGATPDPHCGQPHRNKETPKSGGCGLGAELTFAVGAFAARRARSARS